ncbi:MAG TPA: hypothetical protein VK466_03740, partial [Terriglobales bacterium]|nr:hypothetical protein [Terriglobales bacterium]
PDSTKVLAIANLAAQRYEAWSISALGVPTKICEDAAPWVFSPDGSKIAFLSDLGQLGFSRLWQMNADGSNRQPILEVDADSKISGVYWSPEGQHVGYLQEIQRGPNHEAILGAIDLRTGTRQSLISNQDIKDFLWLPHGRIIYNVCQPDLHGLSCNFWDVFVNAETGRLQAKPRRLTQWAGFSMVNATVTADGNRLAFQRSSRTLDVYVAGFDRYSRKLAPPTQLTHEEGMNFPTGWTSDSTAVLLGSNRTGQWEIFRQNLAGHSASPLAFGMETIPMQTPISPDRQWLMTVSYAKGSPWFLNLLYPSETGYSPPGALYQVPISGGPRELVLDNVLGVRCTTLEPGFCAVLQKTADRDLIFRSIDPVRGEGRTLAQFKAKESKANYDWDLAPDGSSIDLFELMGSTIHLIDLASGKMREISVAGPGGLPSAKFSSDGFLAFKSMGAAEQRTMTLFYVDRLGRADALWKYSGAGQVANVSVSPNGRHVAFAISKVNSNVWILDNL